MSSASTRDEVAVRLDLASVESYKTFLAIKSLPRYRFEGRLAYVPREYADMIGVKMPVAAAKDYRPESFLFDYQRDIARLAIRKRKFATFICPGYGKSLIDFEFAHHALDACRNKRCLLVAPLMVVRQMIAEHRRFYPDAAWPLERVRAAELPGWLHKTGAAFGITNYEAIREGLTPGNLGILILSESSMLKSMYGNWGRRLIELGRGLEWKLCETGTPAPNDRIEYASHSVFLDQHPTVNSFLARYFVNRGQTDNRWELKPHALRPFYRSLSHWCIFMENPKTYGWKDNADTIPPIHVHIHDVPLTQEQRELVGRMGGDMFGSPGGITSRAKLSQLAKGTVRNGDKVFDVATNKPGYIRDLVRGWEREESTLVWCVFNREQDTMEETFPDAASIRGETPEEKREQYIDDFQQGRVKVMISKPECMGLGLNLQVATRQIFNGLRDSFEEFFQCVKRSNRVGSTRELNVHVPITEVERAMVDTVLAKAKRVQQDADEQEAIYKENATLCF